jgi:hypothetical protein
MPLNWTTVDYRSWSATLGKVRKPLIPTQVANSRTAKGRGFQDPLQLGSVCGNPVEVGNDLQRLVAVCSPRRSA